MRVGTARIGGDDGLDLLGRVGGAAGGEQQPCPHQAGIEVFGLLDEHLVDHRQRIGRLALGQADRRDAHPRHRPGPGHGGNLVEHRQCLGHPVDGDVVIGQLDVGTRLLADACDGLEERLSLRRALRAEIEDREGPVGQDVLRLELMCRLQDGLGGIHLARCPEKVGERQVGHDTFRVEAHRLAQGRLCLRTLASGKLEGAERGVQTRPGLQANRAFQLLDRGVQLRQARQRIGAEHERVHALGILRQGLVRAQPGIVEPPREHQQRAGFDLHIEAIRQQIAARTSSGRARPGSSSLR